MNCSSDFFCPLPWRHLSTHPNGDISICCRSTQKGLGMSSTEGQSLKLGVQTLDEIINSDTFKKIRRDFLSCKVPDACQLCFKNESRQVASYRQAAVEEISLSREQALRETSREGIISPTFEKIELRLGNKCNLKCISCNPISSSQWAKERESLVKLDNFPKTLGFDYQKDEDYLWPQKTEFWSELTKYSENILSLNINGGEPTLIDDQIVYLKDLVNIGSAKNINLSYYINGTSRNQNLEMLWDQFKSVTISISIDDFGERNSFIRFPSVWKKIESTLRFYISKNYEVNIMQTVSALNFFTIHRLSEWLIQEGLDVSIGANYLESPSFLTPFIIPAEKRRVFLKKLAFNKSFDHREDFFTLYFNDQFNEKGHEDFKNYMNSLDLVRGTDSKSLLPELFSSF